jgi:hypothetical protein
MDKWSYDLTTRTITIRENGEYHLGSLEHYFIVKVEVASGSKEVPKEGEGKDQ